MELKEEKERLDLMEDHIKKRRGFFDIRSNVKLFINNILIATRL